MSNEKNFCNLTVQVRRDFDALVKGQAKKEGLTKSDIVRKALRLYLGL